ncbi:MAG: hypothetical protein JNK64_28105 [Myxococcales bacterium]|nr:hypothetical protein [Myxococcales bacterium]
MTTIAIVIDHRDPATVAEAWRAAVGVSLRGARVIVAVRPGSADGGAGAARARATLALFGHAVDGDPDRVEADVVEHWYDGAPAPAASLAPRPPVVHLVRAGRAAGAVAPGDRVLQLGAPADVDYDRVLDAIAAAPPRVW